MSDALWDHILFQARLRPNALAVWGPAGPVTYQALVRDVDALATELIERKLTRDDMVGLHLGFTYLHHLLVLALDRLSIPAMSFATAAHAPSAPVVLPQFGLTAIVSDAAAPAAPPGCRWIVMAEQHRPTFGTPDTARLARLDRPPDALVCVGWSSGTTGGVKGAPITRALQGRRLAVRRLLHGLGRRTRYFTGMPISAAFGYHLPLAVLSAGGAVILPAPASDFVSLANALKVTLTGGPPSMLAELVGGGAAPRRLDTLEGFEVLGTHLPAALAREVRLKLTANLRLGYGATEADRVATADAAVCLDDPSAVGYPIPWVEVEIVDAGDRALPAGREGILRLRSPQTIAGYFRDEAATRRNFRDGWFYPGDIAQIDARGLLRVTGRIEETILRDGVATSPQPIEDAIRTVPGVRDVAVFPLASAGAASELGVALVVAPGADGDAIRTAVAARLGPHGPARLFMIDRLPRNQNGKVNRRELGELAQRAVAAPPKDPR
jgi:acyl-CoA synthetase (AMP-forming)/AMP-acid ligase II